MINRTMPIPLPPKLALEIRDHLIDRLQAEAPEAIIAQEVVRIQDWAEEPDPYVSRQLRLLAKAHTEVELNQLVRDQFNQIVRQHSTALIDEAILSGGNPVLVAFAVGVGAGIAANWIYDEFIEGDETYTTEIVDENGVSWTIVTDENGRVLRVVREGHSP